MAARADGQHSFGIEVDDEAVPIVIRLIGDVDVASVPQLRYHLRRFGDHHDTIVLDLSAVTHFGEPALEVLADARGWGVNVEVVQWLDPPAELLLAAPPDPPDTTS